MSTSCTKAGSRPKESPRRSRAPLKSGRPTSASEPPLAGTPRLSTLLAAVLTPLLLAALAVPAVAAESTIRFITPWPGALISGGTVIVAGTLPPDASQTHFLLNGRPLGSVKRTGNRFSGTVTPQRGFNEFEVRTGDKRARMNFVYGIQAGGQAPYSYHKPLVENECAACHEKAGGKSSPAEAAVCYQCHTAKAVMFPYVHGPVAAGKCLVCHDPHGSSLPSLTLKRPKQMCTGCHDQPSTRKHIDSSRSSVCTLCHNPHYGMKRSLLRVTF
jgi:predicted CXXCH cytochrome family protein